MVGHPVILRGLALPGLAADIAGPTVLSIIEQDFLGWFLTRLEDETGRSTLGSRDAFSRVNAAGEARLYQPVHRAFNIVAVEVACEVEGLPRLDPKKILGAGITVRRFVSAAEARSAGRGDTYSTYAPGLYGWKTRGGKIVGWRPVTSGTGRFAPDVSPDFRRLAQQGRNGKVLERANSLITDDQQLSETFAPLFAGSDNLCRKLGKTILFGYLPVTSDERSEEDAPPQAPFAKGDIAARLPSILWSTARISSEGATAPLANQIIATSDAANPSTQLDVILSALRYLSQETGLFLEDAASAKLRAELGKYTITLVGTNSSKNFYHFLKEANQALVERNPAISQQRLPISWPTFSPAQEAAIVQGALEAVSARWNELSPGETRFQNLDARYEIQAFVRVDRSDCGCPPQTIWTEPRRPVEIVPWYEGGEAPPRIVELPSPSSLIGKIKPNIAFKVPEEIQKFMSGLKLDKLMDGEQPDDKPGFGMICGFSIPIITICAFIVLQIFLSLFHILFWWLPFIRICIPFPKKGS
jgi:hypothetical protein